MAMTWDLKTLTKDEADIAFYVTHYKPFRLKALELEPAAYGSTLAREAAMDDAFWRDRISNPLAQTFVAMRTDDSSRILSALTLFGPTPIPEPLLPALRTGEVARSDDDEAQLPLHWAVNGVFTLPEARRKGISASVSELSKEWARNKAHAAGRDCLLTVIAFETNASAIALYEKVGFTRCDGAAEPGQVLLRMLLPSKHGVANVKESAA